jgi:probable HAF family extracellular repeat protein
MKHAWLTRLLLVLPVTLITLVPHTARPTSAATVLYSVTDLGTFANGATIANGINNVGQVVGLSDISGNAPNGPFMFHAFRWQDGVMTDLGTLGGPQSGTGSINASGQVSGVAETTNPGGDATFCGRDFAESTPCHANHAALWDKGRLIDLGTFGGPNSAVFSPSINNQGQVVGAAENTVTDPTSPPQAPTPEFHAFLWDRGAMADLGTLGGPDSQAYGINDRSQVAGFSMVNAVIDPNVGGPDFHAFLWNKGNMMDLGTLGGPQSFANSLNNNGQVVGNADTTIPDPSTTCAGLPAGAFPETHPALWQNGIVTDLSPLPGDTDGVAVLNNDRGQAVGWSGTLCDQRAILWQNGTVTDLNTVIPANSGWFLLSGQAINARGQIVGYGLRNMPPPLTSLSQLRAFLLTPNRGEGEPAPARSTAGVQALVQSALVRLPANMRRFLRWPNYGLGRVR